MNHFAASGRAAHRQIGSGMLNLSPRRNMLNLSPKRKKQPLPAVRVEHYRLSDPFIKPDDLEFIARLLVLIDKLGTVNGSEGPAPQQLRITEHGKLLDNFITYLIRTPLDLYIASIKDVDVGYMVLVPDETNAYEILAVITDPKNPNREHIVRKLIDGATNIVQTYMYQNKPSNGDLAMRKPESAIVHTIQRNSDLWKSLGFQEVEGVPPEVEGVDAPFGKDYKRYILPIARHAQYTSLG